MRWLEGEERACDGLLNVLGRRLRQGERSDELNRSRGGGGICVEIGAVGWRGSERLGRRTMWAVGIAVRKEKQTNQSDDVTHLKNII